MTEQLGDDPLARAPFTAAEAEALAAGLTDWQRATPEDVRNAYQLFMGRDAESDAVVEQRVGQTLQELVFGSVGSDEFANWIAAAGADLNGLPPMLAAPPAEGLREWSVRLFELDGPRAAQVGAASTLLDVLCGVLRAEQVSAALERALGAGGGARVAAALDAVAGRMNAAARAAAGTTAEDIYNLYLLLLDRTPESAAVAGPRPDQPLAPVALEFLTSHEFAVKLAQPVLNGHGFRDGPLAPSLQRWAHGVLGLDLARTASRTQAIAGLIAQPAIRAGLEAAALSWPLDALVAALDARGSGSTGGSDAARLPLHVLLEESGLFDAEWYLSRYADVRRTGADPLDHFVYCGAREGRDPGPGFETAFYLDQQADRIDPDMPPIEHFLRVGRAEGLAGAGPPPFERWVTRFDALTDEDRARIAADAAARPLPPLLCLALDEADTAATFPEQVGVTPRIVAADRAGAALAGAAEGTVVVLAGDGASLREHGCYVFANALTRAGAEAAYSDHDRVDPDGRRGGPLFKPAMSPDLLQRVPYTGPVAVIVLSEANRAAVAAALAAAPAIAAAAAVAALLGTIAPERVLRVPLPLFSLRVAEVERPYDPFDQVLEPTGLGAVEPAPPLLAELPRVSIIIPTRDRWHLVRDCVDSIFAESDYPADRIQLVVVDNDSSDPDSLAYLRDLASLPNCLVVPSPGPFNFAKICNDGAAQANGEVVLFLNNDTTVIAADWLRTLVAHALRPEIGAVGAQLLYPDDTVQHGGVVLGLMGVGGHRLIGAPRDEAAVLDVTREMTAVTGACLALRRSTFEAVGGLDTVLGVAFNDVDLCIRVFEAGYRNLYVARPLLYHHESKSRGFDDTRAKVERNAREAIYARGRYNRFFRDDPSYSPNLSLQRLGALANPPRVMRPWRRDPERRHVLLLAVNHGLGHGVACVVAEQAERFRQRGWSVTVGGTVARDDRSYPGCRRVRLTSVEDAAAFAVAEGVDCVIAHTPPFFSLPRYLGHRPLFYVFDHGEPPPELFHDVEPRREIDWEKRFCAPLAHRVFTISQAIHDQQFRADAITLRNGNSHLASWNIDWAARRAELRRKLGFEGRFVVLNVCRFHEAERAYKGVDDYLTLASEARYVVPDLADRALFVLAGRGDAHDVAFVRERGITVFPNVSDAEMAELYAAADAYVSLSRWEGYNLGIGQALAMGLEAIGSDIPAHREFGVPTASAPAHLCRLLGDAFARWNEAAAGRTGRVESWDGPVAALIDRVEDDVVQDLAGPWL